MRLCATDFWATYRVVRPFQLPYHSGSLLRGVLGRSLRRVGCADVEHPCEADCAQLGSCAYSRLFDPPAPEPAPHRLLHGVTRAPQPLIPLFPPPGRLEFKTGDAFELGARLLGPVRPEDGFRLTAALEGMADFALGRDEGQVVFEQISQRGPRERPVTLEPREDRPQRLRVDFETPAWLEQRGRLMDDMDCPALFRAVHRRLTTVCALYGSLARDHDEEFARRDRLVEAITTVERRITAVQWERHALEREERHPMKGILGFIVFEGAVDEFLPLFRMAEVTHIGKATSYGLGRIRVRSA